MFGEDIGYFGGVFRVTEGLQKEFGKTRVFDAPISEGGIVATAVGMAAYGLKPRRSRSSSPTTSIPATTRSSAKSPRCATAPPANGPMPMVIRTPYGGGIFGGQTHSQSPESLFTHIAGLKVVIPSTPYDAKGLLIAAIEDPDPVIFFEPKRIYNGPFDGHHDRPVKPWSKHPASEVPEGHYTVPLGKAAVVREGEDAHHPRLRHDGPRRARRGRGAGPRRRGHRPAHARPARHRDDRAIGRRRPAAASSSTKRRAPAASAPSWSRWCRSAASIISKRRSSASPAGTRPTRTPTNGPISPARSA